MSSPSIIGIEGLSSLEAARKMVKELYSMETINACVPWMDGPVSGMLNTAYPQTKAS